MHRGQFPRPLRHEDFDMDNGTLLGCGALAFVNRCQHKPTGRWVAVKIISKIQVLQTNRLPAVTAEKEALYALGPHPSVPFLHGTMQSEDELYFALELVPNGDLLEFIRRVAGTRRTHSDFTTPCLTLRDTRLVTAQLVLALQHVFAKGYCLRDLKPENVLFRGNGRAVLCDFDTSLKAAPPPQSNQGGVTRRDRTGADAPYEKVSQIQDARKQSSAFCGTAQYVSPEAIGDCRYSFASDLFALGCTVYHMLSGEPLFNGPNAFFVMQEIRAGVENKQFPASITRHPGAEAFIRALLITDPVRRLGVSTRVASADDGAAGAPQHVFDVDALRAHAFFADFDWEEVDDVRHAAAPEPYVTELEARLAAKQERLANKGPDASSDEEDDVTESDVKYWRGLAAVPVPDRFDALSTLKYDDAPAHSDEYAQYVHRVGDGPLERAVEVVQRASDAGAAPAAASAAAAASEAATGSGAKYEVPGDAVGADDSCSDASVEDDVGVSVGRGGDVTADPEWCAAVASGPSGDAGAGESQ